MYATHPDARRHRNHHALMREAILFDHLSELIASQQHAQAKLRQDHPKFLAAQSGEAIFSTQVFAKQSSQRNQHGVACGVTVGVVHFEKVDIDESDATGRP